MACQRLTLLNLLIFLLLMALTTNASAQSTTTLGVPVHAKSEFVRAQLVSAATTSEQLRKDPLMGFSSRGELQARYGMAVWVVVGLIVALIAAILALVHFSLHRSRLFRRFNALFYFSPSAKLLVTKNARGVPVISEANYAAARIFDVADPGALVGVSVEDLSPANQPDGKSSSEKAAQLIKEATPTSTQFLWEHLRQDGTPVLTEATLIRFNGDRLFEKMTHQPLYLVALQDITEKERARKELEEERNALQGILWGTAAGTWEWEVQTGRARFNERWAEMIGYRLEELEPTTIETWLSLCHPEDQARSSAMLDMHFCGERESYDIEVRMRHKQRHWIWVQTRGRVVSWTAEGEPLLMAGTQTDITQRKLAENKASELVSQMRKHAALLPGTLYQYWEHPDGRKSFPYASQGIYQIYGVTPDEAQKDASLVFNVIESEDLPHVADTIQNSRENLTNWRTTYRVNHPEGHQLWVEGIASPERLEDGSTMWHGYLHDVTEEHINRVQLEAYRQSLERSNRDLEHFAYAASHDLRQPLRMVTSYAQLLERHLKGQLDEDGTVMLHYMRDGAQRMDTMLLSLLDYSRVGRKGQPKQALTLRESLDEALHFLRPNIEEVQAEIEINGEWPEVLASPDEMTRLFQNLLSNALKYRRNDTPAFIQVATRFDEEKRHWVISVCDNGIGIAPDQTGRLFKVFQRLHTREQYEGNGVGLAICRKIIERHGGEIWVESEGENRGTCIFFTLPTLGVLGEGS